MSQAPTLVLATPAHLRQMAEGFRIIRFVAMVKARRPPPLIGKTDIPVEAQNVGVLLAALCETLADAQERIEKLERACG